MTGTFVITYKTHETLDHTQSQVAREKPAVLDEFKNKVAETIQKYFGEFAKVYENNFPENSFTKISEHSQTFIGCNTTLNISDKVKSSKPGKLGILINRLWENDGLENEEFIKYSTVMRIRKAQQGMYLAESQPAIEELVKILEEQKVTDKDAKIKYGFSDF